uniref:hypothetical protein n=1 Tax=Parerythrobacter lutipelagi TaxID=1964208 RepID=UPI0010F49D91|nr:hypothetical protein [Parerythrobacter lutipelagi]
MRFLRRLNPIPGIKDFWHEFRRPNPRRIPVMVISVLIPLSVLYVFAGESYIGLPRPPEVIYISTFDADRTQEQIIASNIANQRAKEERAALEQERLEVRRDLYRTLGEATGVDVDGMEREIAEDEARAAEAAEAERRALLSRAGIEPDEPATAD